MNIETSLQRPVYLVDGLRTPQLKAMGVPGPFRASDLAVTAGRSLLLRQPFKPDDLDEVLFGCVSSGPDEANIARVIALRLGCGDKVPAWSVQRNCASGMQAVDSAAKDIALGRANLVLAGGTEAMSHHPVLLNLKMLTWLANFNRARSLPKKLQQLGHLRGYHLVPVIALLRGLTDPIAGLSMGQTTEELASQFDISREEMDTFAVTSHQRLAAARDRLRNEIVPLFSEAGLIEDDDGLRLDSSVDNLAKLKPVFDRKYGRVTAGNSAQVTDGASCLLLASEEALQKYGLTPSAEILDISWAGLDPRQMGLGPVYAIAQLLKRHQVDTDAIDWWEINEAFAGQVIACLRAIQDPAFCRDELNTDTPFRAIPPERLNPDGGGISLGHPVGTSGSRITMHLARVLEREQGALGIASLCIGGGQGGALLMRRVTS